MLFLYPIILSLATAVSIPVLIHLFSKRPPKVLELPTSILLIEKNRKMHFMRFKNLRKLLLLLIRSLIILLLVLPFAGLMLKDTAKPAGPDAIIPPRENGNLVFLVDVSASMSYESEGQNSIDRVRQTVDNLLHTYKPETVSLYSFTSEITELVPVQKPHYEFNERFKLLKPTLFSANGKRALPALKRRLKELNRSQSDIVVITDMQKNVFPNMKELNTLFFPYFRSLSVVDCSASLPGNCSVSEWQCRYNNNQLIIDYTITNNGLIDQDWAGEIVDHKAIAIQASKRSGTLKPGESTKCSIAFSHANKYWQGYIQLSEDNFNADNKVHISYLPPKPPFCYVMTADPKQSMLHILAALDALNNKHPFDSKSGTLESWLALPHKTDLMILANASLLEKSEVEDFIANGGKAIVYTGKEEVNKTILQTRFNGLSKSDIPLAFKRTKEHGPFREAYWFQPLLDWRLEIHQPLSVSEDKHLKIYARYTDDIPAVFSQTHGKGEVLFFNFPCSATTGAPVNNVEYAMLLHRAVATFLPHRKNQCDIAVIGQNYSFTNQTKQTNFTLTSPSLKIKKFTCPAFSSMQLPLSHETGIHEIRTPDGNIIRSLAVNLNPSESDFTKAPKFKALFRQKTKDKGQENSSVDTGYFRSFLSILLIVLLLMLTELFIDWRNK